MARIRTIKPDFFRHEGLFELEVASKLPIRVAFAGLWTAADREGRFKWKPRQLKLDCLPFDEVDFSRVLDALATRGFIVKYECDSGDFYGYIPSWHDHQIVNNRESESNLPDPAKCSIKSTTSTREARVVDASSTPLVQDRGEGKGKERKGTRVSTRFGEFWEAWPKSDRKQDKSKCTDKWASDSLDNIADKILADIELKKLTRKWQDDDGKYIEAPLVYLNNRRWEDEAGQQPQSSMFAGMLK